MGEDLSSVCRVTLDSNVRQTTIQKGTNSPWFNQLFLFHSEDILPQDFMDKTLDFTVYSNRTTEPNLT